MTMAGMEQIVLGSVLDTDGERAICRFSGETLGRSRAIAEQDHPAAASIGGIVKIAVSGRLVQGGDKTSHGNASGLLSVAA